jgi:hypothetical protein
LRCELHLPGLRPIIELSNVGDAGLMTPLWGRAARRSCGAHYSLEGQGCGRGSLKAPREGMIRSTAPVSCASFGSSAKDPSEREPKPRKNPRLACGFGASLKQRSLRGKGARRSDGRMNVSGKKPVQCVPPALASEEDAPAQDDVRVESPFLSQFQNQNKRGARCIRA